MPLKMLPELTRLQPRACRFQPWSARAFYETAGVVKVFVFAFVFSLVAFLFLSLLLPFLVCCIHLGLLSALWVNRLLGFGACWCPMTMKWRCYLKDGLLGQGPGRSRRNASLAMHFGKRSFPCCFCEFD